MRRWILKLHLWTSLVMAVPMLIVGVTGAFLVYGEEIDHAIDRHLYYVEPQGAPLPAQTLFERLQAAYPGVELIGVTPPARAGLSYTFTTRQRNYIYLDPYTGNVLGERPIDSGFRRKMFLLHSELMAGSIGHLVVVISTVVSLFLAVTGLVLWWKFKIWSVKRTRNWWRVNFDLHSVIGLYSLPVIVVLSVTGVLIAYETTTYPAIWRVAGDSRPGPAPASAPGSGRGPTLDEVFAAAQRAVPEARLTAIAMPQRGRATDVYGVYAKFPEDPHAFGRSRVFIDRHSGEVLGTRTVRDAGWGAYITGLIEPIHFGDVFGQPTRLLAFLVSLFLAGQIATGLLAWWKRNKPL